MYQKSYDFIVIGAGIFGITTAIELRNKGFKVAVLNPDEIPHPLAASTDINKIVRMEYGTDTEYMNMAIESIERWKDWNEMLGEKVYHETGYIVLSKENIDDGTSYVGSSYYNVKDRGFSPQRMTGDEISDKFPAIARGVYADGFYHSVGGYAESGRAVELLVEKAKYIGVDVMAGEGVDKFNQVNSKIETVTSIGGNTFKGAHYIVCAGNNTPHLVPSLKPYMKVTGHPVCHLKPSNPELFTPPRFAAFAADTANTGWYGFSLHPKKGVVKVANHGVGLTLQDPDADERVVYEEDIQALRTFLKETLPSLADDPVVYTRRCCYTDTLDGHFWIDNHPEISNLTIGSGGSGHGFKMGPVIGEMISTCALGGSHKWSDRYRWRHLDDSTRQEEQARNLS